MFGRMVRRVGLAVLLCLHTGLAAQTIAITNVTIIDGTGAQPRANRDVIVEGGKIRSERATGAALPASATRIDGTGQYLLPGFIDSNAHASVYGNPNRRDTSSRYGEQGEALALEFAQRQLRYGVTTIRDSYGVLPPLLAVRDRIARGEAVGARMLVAGNIVGWGGPFSLTFSLTKDSDLTFFQESWNDLLTQGAGEELADLTPEELRPAIQAYLAKGVDFVKYGGTSHFLRPSLIGFSPDQQKVIVEETHKAGKIAETHATSPEGLKLAIMAGIDLIQHPELMSRDMPDSLVRLIVSRDVLCGMRSNVFTGAAYQRQQASRAEAQAKIAAMPPPRTSSERWRRFEMVGEPVAIERRNAELLVRAKCRVTIATDNFLGDAPEFRRNPKPPEQEPGIGSLMAIEGLVELGMTPMQALVAGTRNGAAAVGMADTLGTITPGKIADLVLLSADPLADICNIRKTSAVIAAGRLVDLASLPQAPVFGEQPGVIP